MSENGGGNSRNGRPLVSEDPGGEEALRRPGLRLRAQNAQRCTAHPSGGYETVPIAKSDAGRDQYYRRKFPDAPAQCPNIGFPRLFAREGKIPQLFTSTTRGGQTIHNSESSASTAGVKSIGRGHLAIRRGTSAKASTSLSVYDEFAQKGSTKYPLTWSDILNQATRLEEQLGGPAKGGREELGKTPMEGAPA